MCLKDSIDWRYFHSLAGIFDPADELLPPRTKELYLCTVALLPSLWPPPPLPKLNVQLIQTVCGCGGWGVLNCAVDYILQEFYTLFLTRFRTYKIASPPQTKWPVFKGTVSRDFLLLVFFMNQFPPSPRLFHLHRFEFFRKFTEIIASQGAPPVSASPVANLPPVSTTPVANCHRYQRRRRQIMATISGCRHLKVNLKAKIYIYVNSTTQRCPNKIIKNFSICHLSRESR